MGINLKKFAVKRSILSAFGAGIVNLIIVYFTLASYGSVPLFASVAEIWNHSLIGALIPRSIVISLFITITTVFATVKEATGGSEIILKKLKQTSWIKIVATKALIRAFIAFMSVILIASIMRLLFPTYTTLTVSTVIPIVVIFSALVAFSMTYSAVMSTGKILDINK